MAVINEDFVRCSCGNADFEEKRIVTLAKTAARPDRHSLYPVMDAEVRYYCTQCHKEKD